jgi:hypothetical protein
MPSERTVDYPPLRRVESGLYRTDDGWAVSRVDHYTVCANPHPLGRSGDYCHGNEEHEATSWEVLDPAGRAVGWDHDTKRDAEAAMWDLRERRLKDAT